MDYNDVLVPLICGILGGIAGTAVFLKLAKKQEKKNEP